jgi:hypothetical protein
MGASRQDDIRHIAQAARETRRTAMKTIPILAAILAVTMATTAYAKSPPKTHDPGGPIQQGQYCWIYTGALGAGWWDRCDPTSDTPRGMSQRGLSANDVNAVSGGGGGGGGGK